MGALQGRAFAKFLVKTIYKNLSPDVTYFVVINPADFQAVVKHLDPWLDENTHQDVTPQQKGILRLYGDLDAPAPRGHTFCTDALCPRGHIFITLVPPQWHYAPNRIMSRDNPAIWSWHDLEDIALEWPHLAPERAHLIYPRPPEADPLTDAQRALLVRAIDRPALAHWKSVALRGIIQRGYAQPIPDQGQGWYRVTDKGRRYLKRYRSVWDRIAEEDG